jgi:3-hydroxyisobutyrate dehydrogenase-like beta-hydroxyacid dehydrogenase
MDTLGFIGIGRMGAPMAGRLMDAGFPLVVHDRRAEAAAPLVARGAAWAKSPAAVAAAARTIITLVPSSREVREVCTGPEGLCEALAPGALVVEMTSSDPSVTRELAEVVRARGAALIDAPVSGGVKGAREGSLAIMVGGEAADLERVRPALEAMGRRIFHVGPVGAGHAMKFVNNLCSAAALVATIEGVAVAARCGIDPGRAVEILQVSSGRSNASDLKFPSFILNGGFDAGFAISLMAKDLDGYSRLARETGVPSLVGMAATEVYRIAMARGMGDLDHTAVAQMIEEWAKVQLRSGTGGAA